MSKESNKSPKTKSSFQNAKEFSPLDVLRVSSLEQLRAISDPLRVEILETVSNKALTVKQVADLLKKPPTKLYYHMSALEAAGFVGIVKTGIKSGIVEKYYRAVAESIEVDRRLLNTEIKEEDEAFNILQSSILDSTIKDLRQSHKAGMISKAVNKGKSDNVILSKSVLTMTEKDAIRFVRKFKALVKEFDNPEKKSELNYVCAVAFFPKVSKGRIKGKRQTKQLDI